MTTFAPTPEPENWRLSAACRGADPNLFHPERGEDQSHATAFCARCPSVAPCLEFAMVTRPPGVWGNTNERTRERLRPGWLRARANAARRAS